MRKLQRRVNCKYLVLIFIMMTYLCKGQSVYVDYGNERYMVKSNKWPFTEYFLKDSIPDGRYFVYKDSKDSIYEITEMKAGRRNGFSNRYFSPGRLQDSTNYKAGSRDGFQIHYYPNGKLNSVSEFLKGVLVNQMAYFDSTGKLKLQQIYSLSGDFIKETQYRDNGKIEQESVNLNNGGFVRIFYYPNSLVKRVKFYDKHSNENVNEDLNFDERWSKLPNW